MNKIDNIKELLNFSKGLNILFVEDSDIVREQIHKNLENFFKNIDIAVNGKEALSKYNKYYEINNKPYDLVITDINMPIMNGWDFLEEFKILKPEISKKISLFMLSSSIYQADVEKSKQYDDVIDFVTKPLNADVLDDIKSKYF